MNLIQAFHEIGLASTCLLLRDSVVGDLAIALPPPRKLVALIPMEKTPVCTSSVKRKKRSTLRARLAGYSATASAALVAAPAAHATLTNITHDNLSVNGVLGATPSMQVRNDDDLLTIKAGPLSTDMYAANNATYHVASFFNLDFRRPQNFWVGGASVNGRILLSTLPKGEKVSTAGGLAQGALQYLGVQAGGKSYGHPPLGADQSLTGYVGFKVTGTKTYYGWLRVREKNSAGGFISQFSLLATGQGIYGAYGVQSDGVEIGVAAVPEPSGAALGGLGLLALGAAGVRELRRRVARSTA